MRLDLSSQIVLDRVPQRYYRPENEFELSALTRLEKVPTQIYESSVEASAYIAKEIAKRIKEKQSKGEIIRISSTGRTFAYDNLWRTHPPS